MQRFVNYVIVITILGYLTQLIDGDMVPSQTVRNVVRNTDVTLNCPPPSSEVVGKKVTWFFSLTDYQATKSISDDNRFKLDTESGSLLIRNVTIEDAGMFFCCFDGPCIDTFLVVLEFENILSFASDLNYAAGEIIVSSKGDFTITAHHGSEFKVEVVKEPNIPICSQLTRNVVCYKRRRTNSTSYHVKNLNLHNSGQIVIQSSFMRLKGSYRLHVFIQGKPVLYMKSVQTDDGIKFICRGHAYPPPDFNFHVLAADSDHLAPSILLDSIVASNRSTHAVATAIVKHPISGPGTVECTASNSEGITYAVAPLFLENFYHADRLTSIQTNSADHDQLEFKITSPIGPINDGTVVQLQCKSSFNEFSESFVFEYNGTRFSVEGIQQDDSWDANLLIIASSVEQVICIATFKNQSQLSKTIMLPLERIPHETIYSEKELVARFPIKQIMTWLIYSLIVVGLIALFSNAVLYLLLWNKLTLLAQTRRSNNIEHIKPLSNDIT